MATTRCPACGARGELVDARAIGPVLVEELGGFAEVTERRISCPVCGDGDELLVVYRIDLMRGTTCKRRIPKKARNYGPKSRRAS